MGYFQIGEVLALGWTKFKSHFFFLWITLGTVIALSLFIGTVEKALEERSALQAMVSLVSLFFSLVMELGLIRLYLDLIDKDSEGELSTLFSQYALFFRYLGAAILFGLAVAFGMLLFIVPGIYLALKYQFYARLIVDKNLGVLDALRKSGEMTEGVKWQLFGFWLALTGINLLGMFFFGLGLLITIPVTVLASMIVYRKLSVRLDQRSEATPDVSVTAPVEETEASVSK